MTISSLRYFIEIADCKSFTKASERLFVTQPTLSRQIQDLEEELGTRLFVRGRHSLTLTESGERFLREAKEIIKKCDDLRNVVKMQDDESTTGSLRIDYQAFLDTKLMYQTVKSLSKSNEHLDLALIRNTNTGLVRDLLSDQCDVAFTMRIFVRDIPNIEYIPLEANRLQIAVPNGHRLADRDSIDISELANEKFIMLERKNSPLTVDYAVGLCTRSGFSPVTANYVEDIETALLLVGAGKGITFLFSRMHVDTDDVRVLDIDYDTGELDCVLAMKKDNPNPMIPVFVSEIRRIIEERNI